MADPQKKYWYVTYEKGARFKVNISNIISYVRFVSLGFDNFFPKDKKEKDEEGDPEKDSNTEKDGKAPEENAEEGKPKGSSSDDETQKWTSGGFGPFRSQHNNYSGDSGGGGGNVPPNFSSTMVTGMLLVLMTMMMVRDDDDSSPSDFASREITWSDFCNHLLETGQVEKIVVTNNRTMAKVFLKPGQFFSTSRIACLRRWNCSLTLMNWCRFSWIASTSDSPLPLF